MLHGKLPSKLENQRNVLITDLSGNRKENLKGGYASWKASFKTREPAKRLGRLLHPGGHLPDPIGPGNLPLNHMDRVANDEALFMEKISPYMAIKQEGIYQND